MKPHKVVLIKSTDKFKQGRFIPDNPEKYIGDVEKIIFRSSWELHAFDFCDNNPNIKKWGAEEIAIPYAKPNFATGGFKPSRYFPDLYIEFIDKNGILNKQLIEIKPVKQTKPSTAKKQKNKMYENATYIVNQAKWTAAKNWCDKKGIVFRILTENELFR